MAGKTRRTVRRIEEKDPAIPRSLDRKQDRFLDFVLSRSGKGEKTRVFGFCVCIGAVFLWRAEKLGWITGFHGPDVGIFVVSRIAAIGAVIQCTAVLAAVREAGARHSRIV